MQYGYTGIVTTSWRSQNAADADKLSHAVATQLLIWEVVVGERDADFNKVSSGSYNAICDQIATDHPLYSQIMSHYKSIESSVKTHSKLPSFFARSTNRAQDIELTWNGTKYTATLTDTNNVLSNYTFTADNSSVRFSVSGNQLTITADTAPDGPVTVTAAKNNSQRRGIITWSDGKLAPESDGLQDIVTFAAPVTDPIAGYLNIKVSYGGMKIVKTSEDGKVAGINFTITGNGVNETVQTNSAGEIQIDNLAPGTYTVSEQSFSEYAPQESRQVTVVSGQTATVTFNNTLRRGDLTVTKTSEDGLVEGVTFRLYGTSLSGAPVDEYAVTDRTGRAYFRNVLIGTGYTLEEMDVPVRYVVPDSQSAAIEWNTVTRKTFENRLKKWNATVTKRDGETGSAQGDGSLAGAVYGVYQGGKLVDTYTTDAAGQFTTDYYPCGDNWSIKEFDAEDKLLDKLTEVSTGVYEMSGVEYGGYFVKERTAPKGFRLDENAYYFEISEHGKTVVVENKAGVGFVNDAQAGSLKIIKTSSDGKVEGFSFRVTGPNGYEKVFTTNKTGEIVIEGLRVGEYRVSEVLNEKSSPYVLPADKTAEVLDNSTTTVKMHNELRDTPKTGDDSNPMMWVALMGASALGAAACGVVYFKNKKKEDIE